jgi:ribosomal protein L37AE/L43A
MSAPHGYCRACRKEVRARPVERDGQRYWICGECFDVLRDVSWEPPS